jgi:hemerythrin
MSATPPSHDAHSADAIDSEHQVQIGLVRALCDAVHSGADSGQTREILDQVVDYSEVHFLSEQMLMRLCSYPEYDDHVLDHDHMMEMLIGVAARHSAGEGALALDEAQGMLGFLSRHIAIRDRRFVEYYVDWSRKTSDSGSRAPEIKP